MGMEALSLATTGHEPFSESESAGDDFHNESLKKEIVMMYLGAAREVAYPSSKDRAGRLLEITRIVLYDFGLDWNDAYEIVMKFNRSHVSPPVDEAWIKDIVDFAWNHYWTEKDPGWRLDAEQDHFDGEYSIYNHSFILNTSKPNISAKAFLRSRCSVRGMPGLRFFQCAYWAWDGSRYIKTEESQVRSMLEEFLEMAVVRVNDGCMRFPSTMPNVLTPIMESAQRLVLLPNDIQLPYYLGAGAPPESPRTLIIGRTKTLRLRDRAVFDSEPCWFSTGTLDLDPDPYAPERDGEWSDYCPECNQTTCSHCEGWHDWMRTCPYCREKGIRDCVYDDAGPHCDGCPFQRECDWHEDYEEMIEREIHESRLIDLYLGK